MGFIALISLASIALAWGVVEWIDDDDNSTDQSEETGTTEGSTGDDTIPGISLTVESGSAEGTAGNDTVVVEAAPGELISVNTQDGDDLVTVESPNSNSNFNVEVSAGAGDDTIEALNVDAVSLFGESGDDSITGSSNGSVVSIEGGLGNDSLSNEAGAIFDNIRVAGGAGDDVIDLHGLATDGVGNVVWANGGAGNDSITLASNDLASQLDFIDFVLPAVATGGTGADAFIIENDGLIVDTADVDPSAMQSLQDYGILRDGVVTTTIAEITDFDSDEDTIQIDADAAAGFGTLAAARLETDADAGSTELILTYEKDGQAISQLVVVIAGTDVSFDDITFVGDQTPTLSPAA